MVKIGDYIIHHPSAGKIWINREDGEGGQFDAKKLEAILTKFWEEEF